MSKVIVYPRIVLYILKNVQTMKVNGVQKDAGLCDQNHNTIAICEHEQFLNRRKHDFSTSPLSEP